MPLDGQPDGSTEPSRLLDPANRVVPFTGRQSELRELRAWRGRAAGVSVRLLCGGAGQGKTRLAARFAELSTADGWAVSQALRGSGTSAYPDMSAAAGHLVLVDDAERWHLSRLLDLLGDSRHYAPAGTRFLLIAREAGDWWRSAAAHIERAIGVTGTRMRVTPLATGDAERELLFLQAVGAFADVLGSPACDIAIPAGLDSLDSVLAVHSAALGYLGAHTPAPAEDDLREVVTLLRQTPTLIRYADSGQQIRLAGSPSVGSDLLEAFDAVLGDEPGMDSEAGAAAIARRYIGERLRHTRNLSERAALYDRLGRRLLRPGHGQDALDAYAHAVDLRRELVRREDSPGRRSELAYSLSQLGAAQSDLHRWNEARRSLQEALRLYLVLRRAAYFADDLNVAHCYEKLSTVFDGLGSDREALAARQYATGILRDLTTSGAIGPAALAVSLSELAERHLNRGSHADAALRAAEAVPLWRELHDTGAFAALLVTRGRAFWQAGRYAEAEADLHEAIALYRSLGEARIEHCLPIADALTLLGHVRRMKCPADALTPYADVIGLRRRLVWFDPVRRPDLAAAYVTFAWACLDSGERLDDGLTAVIEACLLYHGSDCEELREARALGVQLLEALGRRPEADRVRARLDAPQALADRTPATDREIFAMVVRRDFEAAAEALNTMDPGRAVQLVVLCGPMVAGGLHRDGLADELFEGAQRNDSVAFAELARLIRRRR